MVRLCVGRVLTCTNATAHSMHTSAGHDVASVSSALHIDGQLQLIERLRWIDLFNQSKNWLGHHAMSEDLYREGLKRQLDVYGLLRIGQLYSDINF